MSEDNRTEEDKIDEKIENIVVGAVIAGPVGAVVGYFWDEL